MVTVIEYLKHLIEDCDMCPGRKHLSPLSQQHFSHTPDTLVRRPGGVVVISGGRSVSKVTSQLATELGKTHISWYSGYQAPGPVYKSNLEGEKEKLGKFLACGSLEWLVSVFGRGGDQLILWVVLSCSPPPPPSSSIRVPCRVVSVDVSKGNWKNWPKMIPSEGFLVILGRVPTWVQQSLSDAVLGGSLGEMAAWSWATLGPSYCLYTHKIGTGKVSCSSIEPSTSQTFWPQDRFTLGEFMDSPPGVLLICILPIDSAVLDIRRANLNTFIYSFKKNKSTTC